MAGKLVAAVAYITSSLFLTRILVIQSLEETSVPGREGLKEGLGQLQYYLSREVRIQGHSKFLLPRPTLGPLVPRQRPDGPSFAQTPELARMLRNCMGWRRDGHY